MRLEIVPVAAVHPHEIADPVREARIERRLQDEGVLRDPLVVGAVHDVEGFVLLDGTNRRRALETLGLPHALVQVVDYRDQRLVDLRTWCHLVRAPLTQLRRAAEAISGITVSPVPPLGVDNALAGHAVLAVALDAQAQYALLREPGAPSIAEQLRALVGTYEEIMQRVDCDRDELERRAALLGKDHALVGFPAVSRSQVVTMAMRQLLIPSGITRHVIHAGRALRVNLPLEVLALPGLVAASEALRAHLALLQPRTYQEPTILYDS